MASTSERRSRQRLAAVVVAVAAGLPWQGAAAQQSCSGAHSSMPAGRFLDNGDGTVTDADSKLMWMQCASGQLREGRHCVGDAAAYDWAEAQGLAARVSRDGAAFFNDWRLPALRELATITERDCSNPRTNLAVFPDTPAAPFWSATRRPGDAGERAMALSFGTEGVMLARKDERFHVRLVRTGP